MRFNERKEFLYSPEIFDKSDTKTALRIYAESIKMHAPKPYPTFFEVDRRDQQYDTLWHAPVGGKLKFSREIPLPCLNLHERPKWNPTKIGLMPQRFDKFIISHNALASPEVDYFPMRGDQVYWNGYRYVVVNVVLEPAAYWQQTNVWMGLLVECIVPPDGDGRPAINPGVLAPAEQASTPTPAPLPNPPAPTWP